MNTCLLDNVAEIEAWFRREWQFIMPIITTSVDLRNAGFKLAPVDTNLFPAGFNNINPDFMPLCIQAMQTVIGQKMPGCRRILLVPETHTRNQFYAKSLSVLIDILQKAGFDVQLGQSESSEPIHLPNHIILKPIIRDNLRISVEGFNPCMILLNNDLSSGIPEIFMGIEQPIMPHPNLGWAHRLKSQHFKSYDAVAKAFAAEFNFDDWLINPYFTSVENVDFMAMTGIEAIAKVVDEMLNKIRAKYDEYGITEIPYVVVKADNGTYGMGVMTVKSGQEILDLNRKSRTKMSSIKGSQKVDKVLIQEGVHTFETTEDGAVEEPVVYMIGQYVVGGFYRVHENRGADENLNAPGMHFVPIPFEEACNNPICHLSSGMQQNQFYRYGVIARLAALAAAKELT